MNKKTITILVVSCVLYLVSLPNFCFAKYTADDAGSFLAQTNAKVGAAQMNYTDFISKIVQAGLGIVGLVFFILIFYGGYLWLAARGKDEDIKKAQSTIIAAIIGLMIVVGSYVLTNFVFGRLVKGETSKTPVASDNGQAGGGAEGAEKGCCWNEARGEDMWSLSNPSSWLSSITDYDTCAEEGNTCNPPEDTLCGKKYWQFIPDITDGQKCRDLSLEATTHY